MKSNVYLNTNTNKQVVITRMDQDSIFVQEYGIESPISKEKFEKYFTPVQAKDLERRQFLTQNEKEQASTTPKLKL